MTSLLCLQDVEKLSRSCREVVEHPPFILFSNRHHHHYHHQENEEPIWNVDFSCWEKWLDGDAPSTQESWGTQRSFEPKTKVQLPRLAEFEHQYLQEGIGRNSVGHSDWNDVTWSYGANILLCFRRMHLRGKLPITQQRSQAVSSPCGGGRSPHTSARFTSLILNGNF
jgi:hypothetical protein